MTSITNSPGILINNAAVGTDAWTNPSNAAASDDSYASYGAIAVADYGVVDDEIKIVKSDGSIGTTNKSAGASWPTSDAYSTYGGPSDLWGETWTAEDINNANFGCVLSAIDGNIGAAIDMNYLKATNFGFSIPTGSTVDGIEVEIERKTTYSGATLSAFVDHIRVTVYYTGNAQFLPFPSHFNV